MNRTFYLLEVRRILRDPVTLFFITGLPAFMYVIFGATQEWGEMPYGRGNVNMSVMIAMAAYGAVTATAGIGGSAAVERMQGWGRQLGLTPLADRAFVATKALVATSVAALPVDLIFGLGVLLGAEAPGWVWAATAALVMAGAVTFALYGLVFGLAFRSESAVSAASASLVVLGFLGNVFMPLSGAMLTFAKFTPLYGYVALAKYPMTGGQLYDMGTGALISEPLWQPLANMVAWTLIFALIAVALVRRGRARQ